MYSGLIDANVRISGTQDGWIDAWGTVGFQAGGFPIAISHAALSWTGKLTLSGGGLGGDIVLSDGGIDVAGPNILVWITMRIDNTFDSGNFRAIFTAYEWMKLEGEVNVTGSKGGTGTTLGAGYGTRISGITTETLYLRGGSGLPLLSDYRIVE